MPMLQLSRNENPHKVVTPHGDALWGEPQKSKKRHLLVWLVTTLISVFLYYQYFAVNVLTLYAWNVMLFSLSI